MVKRNKKLLAIALVFFSLWMIKSISFSTNESLHAQGTPENKKTSKIVIDQGTLSEYELPTEATEATEKNLPEKAKDLVQSNFTTEYLLWDKDKMYTLAPSVAVDVNSVADILETNYGHAFLWDIGNGGNNITNQGGHGVITTNFNGDKLSQGVHYGSLKTITRPEGAFSINGDKVKHWAIHDGKRVIKEMQFNRTTGMFEANKFITPSTATPFGSYSVGNSNAQTSDGNTILYGSAIYPISEGSLANGYGPDGRQVPVYTLNSSNQFTFLTALDIPNYREVLPSTASVTKYTATVFINTALYISPARHNVAVVTYAHNNKANARVSRETLLVSMDKNGSWQKNIKNPLDGSRSFPTGTKILTEMSTDEFVYILMPITENDQAKTGVYEMAIAKGDDKARRMFTFPEETDIHISQNPGSVTEYRYFGSTTSRTEDFAMFEELDLRGGFISGVMEKDGNDLFIKSLTGLKANPTIKIQKALSTRKTGTEVTSVIAGNTGKQAATIFNPPLVNGVTADANWPNRAKSQTFGFLGSVVSGSDYAPLIGFTEKNIKVNRDDLDLKDPTIVRPDYGWTVLDNWLITGTKDGLPTSQEATKVYDTYDVEENEFIGGTAAEREKWLISNINKNPNNKDLGIDWQGLGFNLKKAGPQRVSYFVRDSRHTTINKQATTTSRIVNNVTDQTKEEAKAFLDAHNFNIPLSDIKAGVKTNDHELRKQAAVVAWENGSEIPVEVAEEDKFDDSKIIFPDQSQVAELKKATIAKPYPLDIQYKGSSTVTSRIWVFVTNENTTVDNGIAFYADDYRLPLKEAATSTPETLLKKMKFKQTEPNVVVYDYLAQPQDKEELIPLSKGKTDGTTKGLSVENVSLGKVNSATEQGNITDFKFSFRNPRDNNTTLVDVTVTLDDGPEFCFKLERTKEKLSIVEPIVHETVSESYKAIEVVVPKHVSLDSPVDVPSKWIALPEFSDNVTRTYRFNMMIQNDKASIEKFLTKLKWTIANPVDKPGEIVISLHEEELLASSSKKAIKENKVLRTSQVIETNDFRLSATSKWNDTDEINYVDLEWETINDLTQSGYQLNQSEDGIKWHSRSLNYGKQIKVLNVYPDIAGGNTLASWMNGLNLKDVDGKNLIQVTAVSLKDYNAKSATYLKNQAGKFAYDVIMFGSWDANNHLGLTSQVAYNNTREFSDSGRGILFGHDTIAQNSNRPTDYFLKYREDLGIGYPASLATSNTSWKVPSKYWSNSAQVKLLNDGYLMKYPFEMTNGAILTIPAAHNIELSKKAVGITWMEFEKPANPAYEDGSWRGAWYLKTNENIAMIQTGHSSGQSSIDERKIIANTLYNLAQVSLESNGQDYSVKDDVPPEVEIGKRDFNNRVTIDGKDYGKKYQYYVTADTKDKGILKSDVVEEVVTSDIKGYIYVIDTAATTIPPVIRDAFGKVTNINAPVVNPEVSREATISGFSSNNQWLHVIPVDRANNVGEAKHIQIKDVAFIEPPEFVKCSGNIPQKIYIKGKDDQGNSLTLGNQVFETNLRIGKDLNFSSREIPWYNYYQLVQLDGTVITPEVVTVESIKQDLEAIYTRSLTTLHIRQVILKPVSPLVEPLRGEGTLNNTKTLGGTSEVDLPIIYPTRDESLAGFKTITYEVDTGQPFYSISPIIPEYYSYGGHVLTPTNTAHLSDAKVPGNPVWNITNQPEVWITIYLTPNQSGGENPGLYGWNYGNDGTYLITP